MELTTFNDNNGNNNAYLVTVLYQVLFFTKLSFFLCLLLQTSGHFVHACKSNFSAMLVGTDILLIAVQNLSFKRTTEYFDYFKNHSWTNLLQLLALPDQLEISKPDSAVRCDGEIEDMIDERFALREELWGFESLKANELWLEISTKELTCFKISLTICK